MELELKKACFDAYEAAGELTLTQEETAETIVPDYCPDIARIIETTGKVFLHSREMRDGRAEISGTVRVTVLYTPEGEGGIRTLEFAMPFTVETDGRSLPDCAALLADTEPELLETRMLNPPQGLHPLQAGDAADGLSAQALMLLHGCRGGAGTVHRKKSRSSSTPSS
ncbi:MAG: DUF3794 domain-containing protein [Dysosmobacter welbionis]|uniref:DUF3794 domain-containing protein n=1 Tax=Dysosmobacter welbionis TaxID=2093857 RepID=UPI00399151E6